MKMLVLRSSSVVINACGGNDCGCQTGDGVDVLNPAQ